MAAISAPLGKEGVVALGRGRRALGKERRPDFFSNGIPGLSKNMLVPPLPL